MAHKSGIGTNRRLIDIILRDAQRPHAALRILEFVQQRLVVRVEVLVDDYFRLGLALGHLHRPPAEDGYPRNCIVGEHLLQHAGANEAGRACQY